uniref:BF3164 family lipoprotein n=1 Tax=Roseivirga sp. TaxID=1964215 RepID=UPI004047D4A0
MLQLVEYDNNGKRIAGYGKWEPIPDRPELTTFMLTSINGGWFKKDSWDNLYVKAMAYRDRIEIFDYKSKRFITVDGPRLEIPPFQIGGSGPGAIAAYSREIKFGHRDIAFGKQFIYDLYGGFSEIEYRQTSRLAETIYILTKKGEMVAKLNLDLSLRTIAVDEDLGKIYGITTDEEPGIAVFDIPKELLKND